MIQICFIVCQNVNKKVPNSEIIVNLSITSGFLMISELEKGCIGNEQVNLIPSPISIFP